MKSVKRLYAELKPSHYTLTITPDMQALTFQGTVTVDLKKTGRPSQRLTFHQHGLKITEARITKHDKKGDQQLTVARINNQDSLDEVRIHTAGQVYSGDYTVELAFRGVITRNMTGLYPCYFTVDGKQHTLLATQFESHYARELFPCVDEPEAKATFDLTIIAPKDMTVLGNMPAASQEPTGQDGLLATTFETTPKMSTYLLAFVIGELQSVTTKTAHGTEVAIWSTPVHPLASLDFALDAAKRSVEFFENYFGIPYPLQKLDHVGLPDFTAGAMENWGLITYRERLLLAYPGEASQSIKEFIAMVVAHETSHQWFGNLVTMKWWDDLWLNESFANMMEFQAVDSMFPEWHIWESFIMSEGLGSLRRDATAGVQAVRTDVHHPDEINTLFDPSIVYAKGGRLLYMLKKYIGEEAFQKGLTLYFKKHTYGNTSGSDLWAALSEVSGIDVGAFMNPWLEKPGFPVVSVNATDAEVTFSQTHFMENGEPSDGRLWPVPLFANHADMPKRLDTAEQRAKLQDAQPLVINEHSAGHYIVQYTNPAHWDAIIALVEQQKLEAVDRLMLLNSASMLSKAGKQPFGTVLALLRAYRREQSEPVWSSISLILAEARRFIDLDESLEPRIQAFIRTLITDEYARLGWDEKPGESAADAKQRATIIGLGTYAEEPAILTPALQRFARYQQDGNGTAPELRSIIMAAAVKQGVPGAFEWLIAKHDETQNSDLKADIMSALTATKDVDHAKILLGRLKDPNLVKPQDADHWLAYLLRNRYTRETAWQWMVDEWSWIEEIYAHDKSYDDFPRFAAGPCTTKAWQQKYEAFFGPKREQIGLKRNIDIGLNEIQTRVAWLERDLTSVEDFFQK